MRAQVRSSCEKPHPAVTRCKLPRKNSRAKTPAQLIDSASPSYTLLLQGISARRWPLRSRLCARRRRHALLSLNHQSCCVGLVAGMHCLLSRRKQVLFLTPHDVGNIKEVGKARRSPAQISRASYLQISATTCWASTVSPSTCTRRRKRWGSTTGSSATAKVCVTSSSATWLKRSSRSNARIYCRRVVFV